MGRRPEPVEEKRPKLRVVGWKEFDAELDTANIASTVRVIVCGNVEGPYTTFNEFPKDIRERCLNEFLVIPLAIINLPIF